MSDVPQGPGWWFAADGRWYPPHLHPSAVSPPTRAWIARFWPWLAGSLALVIVVAVVAAFAVARDSTGRSTTGPSTPSTTVPAGPAFASPGAGHLLGPVTASTPLSVDRGTVVFVDHFANPGSGWETAPLPSGTTFAYGADDYIVVARGALHHFSYSPYTQPIQQLNTSMTATQSAGPPSGAGFGLVCRRGVGTAEIQYEFLVLGRTWVVERRNGESTNSAPAILLQGKSPVAPGAVPITVGAMCATEGDGRTTRLVLFLNGTKVADLPNVAPTFQDTGWRSGIDVASGAAPSTVTVSEFEERDLAL